MLNISRFLKYSAVSIVTLLVSSFLSAMLMYTLIRFVNSLNPTEAYARGLKYAAVFEQWSLVAYILGLSFLAAKFLYLFFHLRTTRAKIKTYLVIAFSLFLGFGLSGGGIDWINLYTYAFLIPLLSGAFLIAITEDKLTKWLFKAEDNKNARK